MVFEEYSVRVVGEKESIVGVLHLIDERDARSARSFYVLKYLVVGKFNRFPQGNRNDRYSGVKTRVVGVVATHLDSHGLSAVVHIHGLLSQRAAVSCRECDVREKLPYSFALRIVDASDFHIGNFDGRIFVECDGYAFVYRKRERVGRRCLSRSECREGKGTAEQKTDFPFHIIIIVFRLFLNLLLFFIEIFEESVDCGYAFA